MKIAWSGRHTSYAYMFMRAFPEIEFFVDSWDHIFRPVPKNAVLADPEGFEGEFDVLISDYWGLETSARIKARKTVFIDHNEYGHPVDSALGLLDRVDAFVCVSEHKLWTHKELCFSPKARWIWFCFDEAMFPVRDYALTGKVGFVHNSVHGELAMIANGSLFGFDSVGIGHHNHNFMGKRVAPVGLEAYLEETKTLAAAVNVVNGDSCGMSPLELMAQGVPVVFGLSADLPRFLFNGFNCFITRNRASDSIAEIRHYLTCLTEDEGLNQRMSVAARRSVLQELSVASFRYKWSAVLQLPGITTNSPP